MLLDLLASHSLLQVQRGRDQPQANEGPRFHLPEVIREFAAARLPAPRAAQLRARLRHWLIEWARGVGQMPLPALIEPELPNVHAVLLGAQGDGAAQDAIHLALALRNYWELDGMPPHSQQAMEHALALATEQAQAVQTPANAQATDASQTAQACAPWPARVRCDAHELLAYTSVGAGDGLHALAHADAALALAGVDRNRRGRCLLRRVWVSLAIDYCATGQAAPLDEALTPALQAGDIPLQARALHQQGILARYQGKDFARADALFAQAQALWTELGNQRLAHARLRNRA